MPTPKAEKPSAGRPKKSAAQPLLPAAEPEAQVEPRTPRRNEKARSRTRGKLLRAAREVMGRKGIDATAINDITEQAELSFGSFYNYFSSKEEIARAVFIEDALALADLLDAQTPAAADIVELVGRNLLVTLHHALNDPVWGWFLIHSVYSINDLSDTLGRRLARDLQIGLEAQRFKVLDVDATVDSVIGGTLYLLRQILEGKRPASAVTGLVEYTMRGLGVDDAEAQRIARLPVITDA